MKIIELRIPVSKRRDLTLFVVAMDIDIIISYSNSDFLGDLHIICLCLLDDSDIPAEIKETKLNEKFGKYILL